ncbi:hypothetical protein Tco_0564339 [Tanacetum coccineum]
MKLMMEMTSVSVVKMDLDDYYSDNQYTVSIKEDTAYPCLHSPKDHKGNKINTPYPEDQYVVLEISLDEVPPKSKNDMPPRVKISFDDSDDEDYTVVFDKNSFSYKIISTNDLKTDSENDNEKVMPSLPSPEPAVSCFDDLDFFKDFKNEFSAIVYNDTQTSKSDLLTEPILSPQHIDEFDLNDETSLSEYDEEEQNVLYFNDLFPFNIIHPDDLKSEKDNDDNEVDIIQSSGVIMEYLVNISKRSAFWSLNEDILKITILTTNKPYPSRKIRRIRAYTHQKTTKETRSIRRIGDIVCEYSGRYKTWSLLQETPNTPTNVSRYYDEVPPKSKNDMPLRDKMDDPNITMEEYIRLKEVKARKRGKVFSWETAKYGKIWYDEDIHDLRSVETEFPAIAFNDGVSSEKTLSCKPTVSSLNDEIDFRISFDDFDDEDYTVVFDKNSFTYKIISTNDLKTDSKNDNEKVMPSLPSPEPAVSCFDDLDFFKDFENEFPAIVYNDTQTSKSDLLTEPILSPQHIDEFDLDDETSLSEYDEEEQNVLYFNDLFPLFRICRL